MASKKQAKVSVQLPRVPVGKRSQSVQDDFWQQQGSSGALNAYRQLTSSIHKGGRKQAALPGGKLQPLFKNYTAPPRLNGSTKLGGTKSVLPGISLPVSLHTDNALQNHQVFCGGLDDLPDLPPTTVRVYLASNLQDMRVERDLLLRSAVPELQEFCSERGLQFQLVDLHWGLDRCVCEALSWYTQLRQQEIADCHRLSLGPNFVALLGDMYGPQPVPTHIPEAEYDVLQSVAVEKGVPNAELLAKHYTRDHNALPPAYVLQADRNELELLGEVVRSAVEQAVLKGRMDASVANLYYMSELDQDLHQGVFENVNPRNHCLAYRREFRHLAQHIRCPEAPTYIDTLQGGTKVDMKKQELHKALCDKVSQHLGVGNCKEYYVGWGQNGTMGNEEYHSYLDRLLSDFSTDIKHLILQGLEMNRVSTNKKQEDSVFKEALYHLHLCNENRSNGQGQETLFTKLEKFLRDPKQNHKPFLIYGPAGSGKTVTMAMVAKKLKDWFSKESVVVLRFLGTTSESCNIRYVVISITLQICLAYNLKVPVVNQDCSTLFKALTTFHNVLEQVSKEHAFIRPLFIMLDGLDHLQPHEESLRALWAIKQMPTNVHIIVSTLPRLGRIDLLGAMLTLVTDEEASLEVQSLSQKDLKQILNGGNMRKLTEKQQEVLIECYSQTNSPLHLRVLMQDAQQWTSYQEVTAQTQPKETSDALCKVLDRLEGEVGSVTVSLFVAYLATVPVGMHERDLADLLTSNPDVMAEVRQLHQHDVNDVLIFPAQILSVLKHSLRPYLMEHWVYGRRVLAWRHRAYLHTIAVKYQIIYPGIQEDQITDEATSFTLMIHEHMANLYIGKPNSKKSKNMDLVIKMPQPLSAVNKFKLNRLPLHLKVLLPLEGIQRSKEVILFKYEWLHTKLQVTSVHEVILDLQSVLHLLDQLTEQGIHQDQPTDDLDLLFEFLQLAEPALAKDANNLMYEVWGRLASLADTNTSIKMLVDAATKFAEGKEQPLLFPLYPTLQCPGKMLRHTLSGPTHFAGSLRDKQLAVLFSQSVGAEIWSLNTGELLHRFPVNKEQDVANVIPGHMAEFLIIGHFSYLNNVMDLSVWSSETGVRLVQSVFPNKFDAIAVNGTDDLLMVATVIINDEDSDTPPVKCLLGVDVHSKEVKYTMSTSEAHADGITKIWFVDGTKDASEENILTLGTNRTNDLALWDYKNEELSCRIELNHFPDLITVDGKRHLVVACNKEHGAVTLVDLQKGEVTGRMTHASLQNMADVILHEQHVYVATQVDGIHRYSLSSNLQEQKVICATTEHQKGQVPTTMAIYRSEFLFVGYQSGLIQLYEVGSGECMTNLLGHNQSINTLNCIQDKWLVSAGKDEQARVWNLDHLEAHVKLQNNASSTASVESPDDMTGPVPSSEENITCMLVSSSGEQVYTASYDGPVKVWSTETGTLKRVFDLDESCVGVSDLYMAYKGMLLLGHGLLAHTPKVRQIMVWKTCKGERLNFEEGYLQVYCSCVFPNDEGRILTISPASQTLTGDGLIVGIYDLFEMKCVSTLHCNIFGSMDSTNLQLLGFTSYTHPQSAVISTLAARATPVSHSNQIDALVDKMQQLYAVLDFYPQLGRSFFFTFVLEGKTLENVSMDHHDPVHLDTQGPQCALVLPEGCCIAGCTNGALVAWDVGTQNVLANVYDHALAKAVKEGRVVSKYQLSNKPAHEAPVTCLALSTDTKLLVSGAKDNKVKLWQLADRQLMHILSAHQAQITSLSITSDKKMIASGSDDQNLILWRVDSGEKVTSYYTHFPIMKVTMATSKQRIVLKLDNIKPKLSMLKMINFEMK